MAFDANKKLVEVLKQGAFGGTCFRDIYSRVNSKWYKKSWKQFDELGDIDMSWEIILGSNIIQIIMLVLQIWC